MTSLEKLVDGLLLHEIAMFVFGGLFFLVLLFLIILFALRKRPLKSLLPFFVLPIIMLGWPSIAKIQLTNEGLAFERMLNEVQKDPDNEEKKLELQAHIDQLEGRNVQNPEILVNLARGKYALGQDAEALNTIDKIPETIQEEVGAEGLKATILVTQDIARKFEQAEKTPNQQNLEILEISRNQLVDGNKVANNSRLQRYISKSDSLIKRKVNE